MESNQDPNTESQSDGAVARELSRALVGAGAAWARYGLTVARASLQATASLLGELSDRIGDVERRDPKDPAATNAPQSG